MAPRLPRASALVLSAALCAACSTVHVTTHPPDARIVANGDDISETGEFREHPGWSPHQVRVSARGYTPKTVELPRSAMVGWVKWLSLTGSLGCSSVCASAGCCCCAAACNRNLLPSIIGNALGIGLGLNSPDGMVRSLFLVNSAAPDWWTLPAMALGTALGSLPLLGLLMPFLYLHAADEVSVTLERKDPNAPEPEPAPVRKGKRKKKPHAQEEDEDGP